MFLNKLNEEIYSEDDIGCCDNCSGYRINLYS